jgi:CheY-like chemotaxis protein/HPt (histidine-containing phosphotransfer) domain-containing protein
MSQPSPSPFRANIRNAPLAIRPLRVLLAEDNRVNQQFASLVLTKAGHSVEIAGNGRLAVDALGAADFDVVLMDIQMPEMDGVQAARAIRALPEPKGSIPIIAVTAHAMAGAREEYIGAGMNDYISKPFQPAQLLSALSRLCDAGSPQTPQPQAAQPGGAPIEDIAVLDDAQLGTLASVFSLPKIRTLASLYLLDVEARLVLIAQCRDKNDFDGVSRQAHMIVGAAGNLGLKRASALARRLEESCVSRADAGSDRLIGELRACCHSSSAALRHWLEAHAPAGVATAG